MNGPEEVHMRRRILEKERKDRLALDPPRTLSKRIRDTISGLFCRTKQIGPRKIFTNLDTLAGYCTPEEMAELLQEQEDVLADEPPHTNTESVLCFGYEIDEEYGIKTQIARAFVCDDSWSGSEST